MLTLGVEEGAVEAAVEVAVAEAAAAAGDVPSGVDFLEVDLLHRHHQALVALQAVPEAHHIQEVPAVEAPVELEKRFGTPTPKNTLLSVAVLTTPTTPATPKRRPDKRRKSNCAFF